MGSWTIALLFLAFMFPTNGKKLQKHTMHLINTYSIHENRNESIEHQIEKIVRSSNARRHYLQGKAKAKQNLALQTDGAYRIDLEHVQHGLAVNFSIGEPPLQHLALLDTGSDLTWIESKHCIRCVTDDPKYDPAMSNTFQNVTCEEGCSKCEDNNCMFNVEYLSGSYVEGKLGREQFIFESREEGPSTVNGVVFGYCKLCMTTSVKMGSGIFGLGYTYRGRTVLDRLGNKFSYCMGSLSDRKYQYNILKIGGDVDLEGGITPMIIKDDSYLVNPEKIIIGGKELQIAPSVFKGGAWLDTGTLLTFLPKEAYDIIQTEVEAIISTYPSEFKRVWLGDRLCYEGDLYKDLVGFPSSFYYERERPSFPSLIIQFSKGAELELDTGSLFMNIVAPQDKKAFCMTLLPVTTGEPSLIGLYAQQKHNVGYDIFRKEVYFQRIDCELLED